MIKILILCNNLETAKQITNKVTSNLESTRIIGIASTITEFKSIINNSEPDLIITTNKHIINLLKDCFPFFLPGIVLISDLSKEDEEELVYKNYKNLLSINYHSNFKEISNLVQNFIKENLTISKKAKAIKILTNLGFNFKLSGTNYLLDTILYVNSYKGSSSFETLFYDIYPHIAELNNTTPKVIKWSIERSIKYLYDQHGQDTYEKIEKYTGVEYPDKFTSKFIINFIANKLDS